MANNKYITKVRVGNEDYLIKDASAWDAISTIVSTGLDIVVLGQGSVLPTAGTDTMGKLYLLYHAHEHGSQVDASNHADVYDEYVTVRTGTSPNFSFSWEKIGTTDIDLSDYTTKAHKHTVAIDEHKFDSSGYIKVTDAREGDPSNYIPKGTLKIEGDVEIPSLPINSSTMYMKKTADPVVTSLGTKKFVTSVDTSTRYLETNTIYGVSTNLTDVSVLGVSGSATILSVAEPDSPVTIAEVSTNSDVSATYITDVSNASFISSFGASSTGSTSDSMMFDTSVTNVGNNDGYTLFFLFKPAITNSAVIDIEKSDVACSSVVTKDTEIIPAKPAASGIEIYSLVDTTIGVPSIEQYTVATGALTETADGSAVVYGISSSDASAYNTIDSSVKVFYNVGTSYANGDASFIGKIAGNASGGMSAAVSFTTKDFIGEGAQFDFAGNTIVLKHTQNADSTIWSSSVG